MSSALTRSRMWLALLLAFGLALTGAVPASAAPGDLDHTFSSNGWVSTDLGGTEIGLRLTVQRDGRVVVLGSTPPNGAVVLRYLPGGKLDPSFGHGGKKIIPLASGELLLSMALQPDGKIMLAGRIPNPSEFDFVLIRLRRGGALDQTFGGDGVVTTDFGQSDAAGDVVVQPDGRIVAVGYRGSATGERVAVARYRSNGQLDHTFGGDGKVTTHVNGLDTAGGVTLQSDGKIVVAGSSAVDDSSPRHFLVLRYRPGGGLDPTFSGDGKRTVSIHTYDDGGPVAIGPKGRIVLGGDTFRADNSTIWALARLLPHGGLDRSFGGDGKVTTAFGPDGAEFSSEVVLGNGRIVAVGSGSPSQMVLARYRLDGRLDPTFGTGGKVIEDFGQEAKAYDVGRYPQGRLMVAGQIGSSANRNIGVARFLA